MCLTAASCEDGGGGDILTSARPRQQLRPILRRCGQAAGYALAAALALALALAASRSLTGPRSTPDVVVLATVSRVFPDRPLAGVRGFVIGQNDGVVAWDVGTGGLSWLECAQPRRWRLLDADPSGILAVAVAPLGASQVQAGGEAVAVADGPRHRVIAVRTGGRRVLAIDLARHRALVARGSITMAARLLGSATDAYTLGDTTELRSSDHSLPIAGAAISPTGRYAAVERRLKGASQGAVVAVMDMASGDQILSLDGADAAWDAQGAVLYFRHGCDLMRTRVPGLGLPVFCGKLPPGTRLCATYDGQALVQRAEISWRYLVEETARLQFVRADGGERGAGRNLPAFGVSSVVIVDRQSWRAWGGELARLLRGWRPQQ